MVRCSESILKTIFASPGLMQKLFEFASQQLNTKSDLLESINLQYRSLQVIEFLNEKSTSKMIEYLLHDQNQMKLVSILSKLLQNLGNMKNCKDSQQLEFEIKDNIEQEGLIEEDELLIFHTDNGEFVGVKKNALKLKEFINQNKQPEIIIQAHHQEDNDDDNDDDNEDDSDDDNEDDSDEDSDDDM
ncbi:MAG: hypothetical protein EZS28_007861 [Streblomastix strix]|uniref:Uncharacterized protein n=1 Tax=Streblomastix strix TaxID=222440 RepID=A0A5J4WNT6_9EUKA|nr:MAG: hypothetical protein EZS28_007861 [Streblomastix strix]